MDFIFLSTVIDGAAMLWGEPGPKVPEVEGIQRDTY